MMDEIARGLRRLVRVTMGMYENTVQPAESNFPSGGQVREFATVEIIHDEPLGTPAVSRETVGNVPDDVTTENIDQVHRLVASVNFYRRPATNGYLLGAAVSDDPDDYTAITDGAFGIPINGVNRQVTGINFAGITTMEGAAAVVQARLQAALANTTCVWSTSHTRFVVTSPTTGQASVVGGAVAPTGGGTDVSSALGLRTAGGALPVNNKAGIARYSNAAFDRAARLPQRLWLSSARELMRSMELGFVGASPPRNLNALIDSTWESRGQIDLTFTAVAREAEAIQTVLTVPLTTKSQAPGGAVHTENTEVTA